MQGLCEKTRCLSRVFLAVGHWPLVRYFSSPMTIDRELNIGLATKFPQPLSSVCGVHLHFHTQSIA